MTSVFSDPMFWLVMAIGVGFAWCEDSRDALSRRITKIENELRDRP